MNCAETVVVFETVLGFFVAQLKLKVTLTVPLGVVRKSSRYLQLDRQGVKFWPCLRVIPPDTLRPQLQTSRRTVEFVAMEELSSSEGK